MTSIAKILAAITAAATLAGCDGSSSSSSPAVDIPGPYAAEELWLCKPGAASNRCLELDQDATYVYSDTSYEVKEHIPADSPEFDCFYVYPTVDLREEPGNTEDLTNDELILRPLYNQAARFTQLCDMYAPLYHQMTIGSYSLGDELFDSEFFQSAFADVDEAFSEYLRESNGRPFVLIGHSQGSHMLIELMRQRFDNDLELRERLISALLLGPVGVLEVPEGQMVGGTFNNIPLWSHASETACIVAFDSLAAGDYANRAPVSQPRPCVNPTELGGSPGILANVFWPANELPLPEFITTFWAAYPTVQTAVCEPDGFLGIGTVANPVATPPAPPALIQLVLGGNDLHSVDANLAMGDLLRIVATQADSVL
jgi:hypothetical protein